MGNRIKCKLSVIIVNYNSLNYLKECVYSINNNNDIGEALEIIVVDNSPNDDALEWLDTQKNIKAVKNENRGFGQGNNVGSSIASGEYLLFLNPDTIIIEPVFKFAINQFERSAKLGLFGVQLVNRNMIPNSTYGLRMPLGFMRTVLCKLLISLHIFLPSKMYTSGADIFIRKNVFEAAGAFDENIFMYCEEADLCNRVNSIGYQNDFFPQKRIIHLEGKTSETNLFTTYTRQMSSRKYYCEKYNIPFEKYKKSEIRYCKLKIIVLRLLGRKARASEYEKIICHLDAIA